MTDLDKIFTGGISHYGLLPHKISSKSEHFTVGGMLMVEIFSIAKSFPLTKLFYLEKISMAKSLHIMNLSAVGDKMT